MSIWLTLYRVEQECEEELTQKAEVVTRLQMKTLQIGQMLNNLQKFNHLLTDDNARHNSSSVVNPIKKGKTNENAIKDSNDYDNASGPKDGACSASVEDGNIENENFDTQKDKG